MHIRCNFVRDTATCSTLRMMQGSCWGWFLATAATWRAASRRVAVSVPPAVCDGFLAAVQYHDALLIRLRSLSRRVPLAMA